MSQRSRTSATTPIAVVTPTGAALTARRISSGDPGAAVVILPRRSQAGRPTAPRTALKRPPSALIAPIVRITTTTAVHIQARPHHRPWKPRNTPEMTISTRKLYITPVVCFDSSASDRIPSLVFSERRRNAMAAEVPCARRKPATEAMWANRSQLYMPAIMEACQQPGKNQLDPQQQVGLLGEPVREQEDEKCDAHPEDGVSRPWAARQPAPGKDPGEEHQRDLEQEEGESIPGTVDDPGLEQPAGKAEPLDRVGLRAAAEVVEEGIGDERPGVPDQEGQDQRQA